MIAVEELATSIHTDYLAVVDMNKYFFYLKHTNEDANNDNQRLFNGCVLRALFICQKNTVRQ